MVSWGKGPSSELKGESLVEVTFLFLLWGSQSFQTQIHFFDEQLRSFMWVLFVAQTVKNLPAVQETWVGKIPWRRK